MTNCNRASAKLILVRHGESKSNEGDRFTGQSNIPLSELGRQQAQRLKEYLLTHFKVDAIYSSDLIRAIQTAEPLAQQINLPITTCKGLREIDGGEWEEKTVDELLTHYADDYALWLTNIGIARCTGGESMTEVLERALDTLQQIAKTNAGKTVLVSLHAGPLRALECHFRDIPPSGMKDIPWHVNTAISILEYQNDRFVPVVFGFSDHVKDMITKLPDKM